HPRILITPSDLPRLRERAAGTHADTYRELKSWCDKYWNNVQKRRKLFGGDTKYDAGILRYALIYLLREVPGFDYSQHSINDYGNRAAHTLLESVAAGLTGWKNIVPMAIAYDWVNDRMTKKQKQTVVAYFVSKCGQELKPDEVKGYRFTRTPNSLYPGLAFYGDGINDDQSQIYVDFIPTFLDDTRASSHQSGNDGGHSAGLGYGIYVYGTGYHLGQDLYALMTATNLTFEDTFKKYPYMYNFPTWLLYGIQPGLISPARHTRNAVATVTKFEDCGSWQWNVKKTDYTLIKTLNIIAQVAKDNGDIAKAQWITWLANERLKCPRHTSTFDIIFNDRTIKPVPPDVLAVPTCKAFGWDEGEGKIESYLDNPKAGLGHVYMKSSWDPGPNTTHAVFKAFPYYYFGHQHFDSLAFSIFKGEPLALPNSGVYWRQYEGGAIDKSEPVGYPHHWYYYERTVSHNSLLIFDPNEIIHMREAYYAKDQKYLDGGQRALHDPGGTWGDVTAGSLRDWGGLIRHEDTSYYTYSSGDATKGYNSVVDGVKYLTREASPKVSLVQRDFVYLKSDGGNSDYFVIFDRIDSIRPNFKKVFLLHTIGEPTLDGDITQIYGGKNGGLYVSSNSYSCKIAQTSAKMFARTLMPLNIRIYKMGGKGTAIVKQDLNDTSGTELLGPKIDIKVSSTEEFTDNPVVTIDGMRSDGQEANECFMCEGKTVEKLTGCIRGKRYYKANYPINVRSGAKVVQEYAWMIREGNTGNWISFPYDFGQVHRERDLHKDVDEYGRWALWIESENDEIHTNFITVLHPTVNMAKKSMAETMLINTANTAGALIKDSSNQWIVIFSKTKNLQNNLTYNANYSGQCKHLITGVKQGIYDIYKNGEKIYTKKSSNKNTLFFESVGGKLFKIIKSQISIPIQNRKFYS
ncbi:MAG: hypothetical protein ACFFCW_22925, partial [Candidatus Hodarchaeota archaeon]